MDELRTPHLREVLSDLPYLVAIAEAGGVTAAADELGVPQPTVSRGWPGWPTGPGAPMLVRNGRGVELSPEALELLPYAQRAVAAVRAGTDAVRGRAEDGRGTATVAFQHTLGRTVVPALLRAVLAARPGTRFELRQGSRELCVEALEAGQTDVALVSPPYDGQPGVVTVRLYAEPLVLAVPPEHPFARRRRVRLAELTGQRLLQLGPEFGLRGLVDRILSAAGAAPERGFEGEDVHTLRGLVAVGPGGRDPAAVGAARPGRGRGADRRPERGPRGRCLVAGRRPRVRRGPGAVRGRGQPRRLAPGPAVPLGAGLRPPVRSPSPPLLMQ